MAYLKIQLYNTIKERYGREVQEELIRNWQRFLGDCFLNWNTKIDTANNIVNILNSLHLSIKFEEYTNDTEVNYLDITIRKKENGKIMTDLFQKLTDSHHYIPFNSCNASQTKRNTPFNSARRICTIVDEETSIDEHMKELKKTLSKQGYPAKLIGTTIKEAKNSQKNQLQQQK